MLTTVLFFLHFKHVQDSQKCSHGSEKENPSTHKTVAHKRTDVGYGIKNYGNTVNFIHIFKYSPIFLE